MKALKPDRTVESAIFDAKLIDAGVWAPEEKEKLEAWTKIYRFADKRIEASKAVAYMIPRLLGSDCTNECNVYSRRLAEKLILFEDLLYTTRGGIAKKFYRDHLNHMLRTAILSKAIAEQVKCLDFDDEETRFLVIAALTHDISYPLAEASKMLSTVASAIGECYQSLKFVKSAPHLNVKGVLELNKYLDAESDGLDTERLADSLENHNHGLMSALEFLFYVKEPQKYKKVIEAIALHDSEFLTPIVLLEKKILAALILSDEMQDWGRPVSFEEDPSIAEIDSFQLEANKIGGNFDLRGKSKASALRLIYPKARNLSRISLKDTHLDVELTFSLPEYNRVSFSEFEELLQNVFDYHPTIMELPVGFGEGMFLESYYGTPLLTEDKERTIDSLSKNKLLQDSRFSKSPLYLNEFETEALFTPNDLGELKVAKILSENEALSLELRGEKGADKGSLLSQKDVSGQEICRQVVAELFIFNSILADIRKSVVSPIGLYLTTNDVKTILAESKLPFKNEMIESLASIHRCLQSGGFFSFKPVS